MRDPDRFERATAREAELIELAAAAEPGDTALEDAVARGLADLARDLLERGARPKDLIEMHGRAARLAARDKAPALVQAHLQSSRTVLVALMAELAAQCRARTRAAIGASE